MDRRQAIGLMGAALLGSQLPVATAIAKPRWIIDLGNEVRINLTTANGCLQAFYGGKEMLAVAVTNSDYSLFTTADSMIGIQAKIHDENCLQVHSVWAYLPPKLPSLFRI